MKYTASYHNAHQIQKAVHLRLLDQNTDSQNIGSLTRAWLDLEWFKRELRGLPRLRASELLKPLRSAERPRLTDAVVIAEVTEPSPTPVEHDAPKESTFADPVPTPPTPEPPSPIG